MSEHEPPPETVIAVDRLTRHFGAKVALNDVSLSVARGTVFGLVGQNGAGKTTLIRHLLGLLRADAGSVRVFGLDPVVHCMSVLGHVGYLSEDNDLPGWMRVAELCRYNQAFYPGWDQAYAEELQRAFGLDPSARVRHLSRGQRARVGLLVALAYRPDLLLLDEPSSGLDPLVRRDILGAIIRTIADQGRTVLFSSHLLDEVERVSDHVALLHQGRVVLCGPLDDVKGSHHRLTVRFETEQSRPPALTGALSCEGAGHEWTVVCNGRLSEVEDAVVRLGARIVERHAPSLDEIFVAQVGTKRPGDVED
jgi:ABC-2 type transport system ATP-binding protein